MISNIISPIITPIITDILGVGEDEAFSIIINGAPSWYSDYTREDVGYSIGTAGGSVEVPQDVPMYNVYGNDKLCINYSTTQQCLYSEDPTEWAPVSCTTTATGLEVGNYSEYIISSTGADFNRARSYITPDSANPTTRTFFKFLYNIGTSNRIALICRDNIISAESVYRGEIGSATIVNSSAGSLTILKDEVDGDFIVLEGYITWLNPSNALNIGIGPGSAVSGENIKVYTCDIYNDTISGFPHIPSTGSPVTVNQPSLSLLAEDINKASYCFDSTQPDSIDIGRPSALNFTPQTDAFEIEGNFQLASGDSGTIYSFGASPTSTNRQIHLFLSSVSIGKLNIIIGGQLNVVAGTYDDGLPHSFKLRAQASSTGLTVWVDDIEVLTSGGIGAAVSIENAFYGTRTDSSSFPLNGYIWDMKHYSGNDSTRVLVEHHKLSEYRRDTVAKGENGNDGTATRAVNLMLSENDSWGYDVSRTARTPWLSGTTPFGLTGLFEGVGANDAIGSIIFEDFTLNALGTLVPLASTFGETNIFWIDTSGYLNLSDGTNTATSSSPLVVGIASTFWASWYEDTMHITLDDTKGSTETFTGSLPAIGNRLLYAVDSGGFHSARNVYFQVVSPD